MLIRGIAILASVIGLSSAQSQPAQPQGSWYKGNLHTHTLWSDGDDYPEMVAEWYKTNGYHFLALSDHNIFQDIEKWVPLQNRGGQRAFDKYQARWGDAVKTKVENDKTFVLLANLERLKDAFEESGRFLMIPSEEISAHFEKLPIHVNVTNLRELIKPQAGTSVYDVMQKNIDAVLEQRERTGQPMFPHLNHPNFHFAVTAEDLMKVQGERFFEVYNGHPAVFNEGNAAHPSTERMWDMVLAWRLGILKMEPMFGIAVDDTHHYHEFKPGNSNGGRGWIHVRARELSPEAIVHAMEAGDFYASTGVELATLRQTADQLSLEIKPEPGISYTIQFIGTLATAISRNAEGKDQIEPDQIGLVLEEIKGTKASYKLKGQELYVRAKVISSQVKENSPVQGEFERAWSQPLIPAKYLHAEGNAR